MSKGTAKLNILAGMYLYLVELGDPLDSPSIDGVVARSYAKTTVQELIRRVENSDDPPEMVISEFINMANRQSGYVFRVAYEIAVDLYDRIIL